MSYYQTTQLLSCCILLPFLIINTSECNLSQLSPGAYFSLIRSYIPDPIFHSHWVTRFPFLYSRVSCLPSTSTLLLFFFLGAAPFFPDVHSQKTQLFHTHKHTSLSQIQCPSIKHPTIPHSKLLICTIQIASSLFKLHPYYPNCFHIVQTTLRQSQCCVIPLQLSVISLQLFQTRFLYIRSKSHCPLLVIKNMRKSQQKNSEKFKRTKTALIA